jgi:DNA-binding PadR family transcriptional regulator
LRAVPFASHLQHHQAPQQINHMPHGTRKRNEDLRLGLWRILVLHEAARRPIWGGFVRRFLRERGHVVPPSVVHDALTFMVRKGWLAQAGSAVRTQPRSLAITPAGRQRLDALRREILGLHREIEGEAAPVPAAPARATTLEELAELARRSHAEAASLRSALEAMRAVVEAALQ